MKNFYSLFTSLCTLLCTSLLLFGTIPSALAQVGGPNGSGQWGAVIQMPIVPVAAANLPNGKILTWSAFDRFAFGGNRGKTYTVIFDPATNSSNELLVANTSHDMFCPGTSTLPDGRVIVTGGSSSNKTSIYDPFNDTWVSSAAMNIPRGYHAMVTMGDGNIFAIGGSWSGGRGNKHGEVYANGAWTLRNGLPGSLLGSGSTITSWLNDAHSWLWPAPNGKILHAGPNPEMHWLDPAGNGSFTAAGLRGDDDFMNGGTTVMYETGKVLKVGGAGAQSGIVNGNTYIIDINGNQANVKKVQSLTHTRTRHNSIVLPTGEVLAIGGLGVNASFSDNQSRLIPEMWNPTTETWRSLAPMQTPRNYHSIALLLPDGRVMAAGGGLCGNCTVNHPDAEIFSPPYLFNSNGTLAQRPSLTSAPNQVKNNTNIAVASDQAISSFSLIRYNSATHSTNNDQRRIELVSRSLGNNRYELSIPNPNIAIPGYYMLFAINANGTPSIAKVIQVDPTIVSVNVTNIIAAKEKCGDGKGSITFNFTDEVSRTDVQFSLDGGLSYQTKVPDNSGSVAYDVAPGTYNLYVKWGNGDYPIGLGSKTIGTDPKPNVSSITTEAETCGDGKGKITFNFPDTPTRTGIEFSLDGGTTYKTAVADNSGSISYEVVPGTYSMFARWGNDECPTDLGSKTVVADPKPALTSIVVEAEDCASGKGKITFNFPDTPIRTSIEFSLDGGATYKAAVADNRGSVSYELNPGTYNLFVRWGNNECPTGLGSKTIASTNCNTGIPPVAAFTATPTSGDAPLPVSFDGSASTDDEGVEEYRWNFGDGTTGTGRTKNHTYQNPGQYTARLTVEDREGLTHSITTLIEVIDPNIEACFAEENGEVVIEAENFSSSSPGTGSAAGSSWELISNGNVSGGEALSASPNVGVWTGLNTNGPRLDYDINFSETGIYRVYIRTSAPGANDDSYHVGLNGSSVSSNSGYGMGLNGDWAWADYANDDDFVEVNVPSVGKHTFNIWMREDGVQIDKIVLSKNNSPSGQGPAESGQSPCSGDANQAPIASFTATPSSGFAPLAVSLDAAASTDADGSISSYSWNFGDGSSGSGASISHTYTTVGSFTLSLTVTDNEGLTNQISRQITVSPQGTGPLCHQETAGIVVMEAENYSSTSPGTGNAAGSSWQSFSNSNASNGEGMRAMPNTGVYTGLNINGPRLDYDITFQTAGTYRVYIRANGPTGTDDSFHAGINGVSTTNASAYGMGYTGSWFWAEEANEDPFVEVVVPTTGQHTFNIWMREDGVEVDKIVLKIQAGTPAGQGPTESTLDECSDQNFTNEVFSVQEDGGNADLNWGNFFEEFQDNYVLERSVDGMTYEQLEAEEISVDKPINEHTDPNIHQYDVNRIFYRLRIKDGSGRTRKERLGVLNLRNGYVSYALKAYPNPAHDKLNVEYDNSSGKALHLKVMNSLGQTVHREILDGKETYGILKLDVSNYTQGIYFVQMTDGETSQVIRILVE